MGVYLFVGRTIPSPDYKIDEYRAARFKLEELRTEIDQKRRRRDELGAQLDASLLSSVNGNEKKLGSTGADRTRRYEAHRLSNTEYLALCSEVEELEEERRLVQAQVDSLSHEQRVRESFLNDQLRLLEFARLGVEVDPEYAEISQYRRRVRERFEEVLGGNGESN